MPVSLNGWKQIASFLKQKPRTVQKWEKEHGLPVHRAGSGAHAPVFAFRTEIAHWLRISYLESTEVSWRNSAAPPSTGILFAQNQELRTELRKQMLIARQHMANLKDVRDAFRKASRGSHTTHAAKLQNETEKAFAETKRKLIQAQEQERSRIARELHDDIGQRLALSISMLSELAQSFIRPEDQLRSGFPKLQEQLMETAAHVQWLAHDLHTPKLDFLSTAVAMKSLCQEFSEQTKIEVDFKSLNVPESLPPELSLCLYRILQEALRNAAKHSQTHHIEVRLQASPVEIRLVVRDQGVGFDIRTATRGHALGLLPYRNGSDCWAEQS